MKKNREGHKTIRTIARLAHIPITTGRKPRLAAPEEVAFVLKYFNDFNVVYHRTAQAARSEGFKISDAIVQKIYEEHKLFLYKSKKVEPKTHNHRFYAKYAGQLWHTYLHYLNKIDNIQYYLIAFIDDCTRFVVHWEVLKEKTSIASANALVHALEKTAKPKTITIDNGKEFIGIEFQNVLQSNGIEDWRTHPYTPEQNGKVERFWRTLESARNKERPLDEEYIRSIIHQYNNVWEHSSLKAQLGKASTPASAWETLEHFNGQADACIVYAQ